MIPAGSGGTRSVMRAITGEKKTSEATCSNTVDPPRACYRDSTRFLSRPVIFGKPKFDL